MSFKQNQGGQGNYLDLPALSKKDNKLFGIVI